MLRRLDVLVIGMPGHDAGSEETACLGAVSACLAGADVRRAQPAFARECLLKPGVDLAIAIGVPDPSPVLELLRWLEQRRIHSTVLVILPRSIAPSDRTLAAASADDVILWPEKQEVLSERIARLAASGVDAEASAAYENLMLEFGRANLVGQDPAFLRIADQLWACAQTAFSILITGETGTGKEMFARAVHFLSARRNQPFIPVDCAGLPDHLFENELFGHVRGAYTDAHGEQRGLAALADGGSLFLDEVDSLSLASQAKLLRFLQERQFKPLGSERFVRTDVKIIAASNRNLEQQTAEKLFRTDLYYRLNVVHMELPALRDRPRDIALLAQHFLKLHSPPGVKKSFSPAALSRLAAYHWPGNVRELLNVVQRAITFARGAQINGSDVAIPSLACASAVAGDFRQARQSTIHTFERDYVLQLLQRHSGNVTHAAREAGKERRAFGRLVKKYGLGAQPRMAGRN